MQTFRQFWFSMTVPKRKAFAARCSTTANYLTQLAYGNKNCGEKLAMHIERETKALGSCIPVEQLCPEAPWSVVRGQSKAAA